jgi:hypothetical protein
VIPYLEVFWKHDSAIGKESLQNSLPERAAHALSTRGNPVHHVFEHVRQVCRGVDQALAVREREPMSTLAVLRALERDERPLEELLASGPRTNEDINTALKGNLDVRRICAGRVPLPKPCVLMMDYHAGHDLGRHVDPRQRSERRKYGVGVHVDELGVHNQNNVVWEEARRRSQYQSYVGHGGAYQSA